VKRADRAPTDPVHSSLLSLRFPQCELLRFGSNSTGLCRLMARMTPIRANIVGRQRLMYSAAVIVCHHCCERKRHEKRSRHISCVIWRIWKRLLQPGFRANRCWRSNQANGHWRTPKALSSRRYRATGFASRDDAQRPVDPGYSTFGIDHSHSAVACIDRSPFTFDRKVRL